MRLKLKRALAGVVGVTLAASLAGLTNAAPAAAAPSLQGAAAIRTPGGGAALTSGNSSNNFTLRLPSGAACAGDASAGYRVQGYFVSASIDPATLTFDSNGPIPDQFGPPQSTFRQPLIDTTGSPYLAFPAAATPPSVVGTIINIPDFTFQVYGPGNIPPGAYNMGIACIDADASTTVDAIEEYWNVQVTFTTNAGDGFANVNWAQGATASAPVLNTVTPGSTTCTANFTPGVSDPAATSFTATATGPGGPFTATGAGSPLTITGLANGTAYSVSVTATNAVGTSVASNSISCTPVAGARTNVTGLTATLGAPGSGNAALNWTAPGANTPPATPVSYDIVVTGPTPGTFNTAHPAVTFPLTGLTAGAYTVTVTALYADAPTTGTVPGVASVGFSINAAQVLFQQVDVTRPVGALVLTQVCGSNGPIPADPASPGFPGGLPAEPAVNGSLVGAPTAGGTAPTLTEDGADFDPNRPEYPYPTAGDFTPNPNYPTHCGLDLGIARFVTVGAGAGQFFAAEGVLNQVSIVDTRDDDIGWTINGTMGTFAANGGSDTFSGSQLGWNPVMTDDTDAFTDSLNNTYDQTVTAGVPVAPNAPAAGVPDPVPGTPENEALGLSSGRTLARAAAGTGLGTAILDARLKVLIPVTADAGIYEGTLTITSV